MTILKRIWKWIIAVVAVVASLFIWTEIKRKKAIKENSKKKLDKLVQTNINYNTQIKNVQKVQNKLNREYITEQIKFERLETEKKRIRDKMSAVAKKKTKQHEKILTLTDALIILEKRYEK